MKTNLTKIVMLLFLSSAFILNAQTKDSVRQKLKDLKGKANKITIQTDGGELTFEGKEADYLLRKMKRDSKSFSFVTPDDLFANGEKFHFDDFDFTVPKIPKVKVFKNWDDDFEMLDEMKSKVTIEKKDGQTKVTVKKKVDWEEVTEVYEGEDAEKYIDEMNEDEPVSIDFKLKDKDSGKKETRIIIIK